jgi:hypothetical protein
MVEPARRHGPFDTRYQARTKLAAAVWELQPAEDGSERLDWPAFLARFFPTSRRHHFNALAGYDSYRNAVDHASAAARIVARPASGDAPSAEDVVSWEWEGGAVTERIAG